VTTLASIRAKQKVVDRPASTSVTAADIGAMARQVFRDGPVFTRFLQHHRPCIWLVELIEHKCFPVGAQMEAATALMVKQHP
jgi:hypothetical protein